MKKQEQYLKFDKLKPITGISEIINLEMLFLLLTATPIKAITSITEIMQQADVAASEERIL